MARIHRNGNLIIRVSDIALAAIKSNNPTNVEIGLRTGHSITIKNETEEEALNYLYTLQKLMKGK